MTALRKILVVDDDPVVGASFKRVLSGKGYIVVSADNGQAALDRLQAEPFDAVFTDLRMPGMDGMEVAEKVRAAQPWTPVVIVTGYGSPANEARARAAGVTEFLHKPLSPDMIEDSAARALRTVEEGIAAPRIETPEPAAAPAIAPAEATAQAHGGMLKNMVLFLAAPFIGLVYAVLLPFVGLGMLLWFAGQGLMKKRAARTVAAAAETVAAPTAATPAAVPVPAAPVQGAVGAAKMVLLLLAAPFIGLAYVVVVPFAALGVLAWMAAKATFARAVAE